MKQFIILLLGILLSGHLSAQTYDNAGIGATRKPGADYRTAGFILLGAGTIAGIIGISYYPTNGLFIELATTDEQDKYHKKEKEASGYLLAGGILAASSIPLFIVSAAKDREERIRVSRQATELGRVGRSGGPVAGLSYTIPLGR